MITNINEYKKINENKEKNVKFQIILNSPYKWGKGWTASGEMLHRLKSEFIQIVNNIGLESKLNRFDVVVGEKKYDKSNIISAYMHPMELTFELEEYNETGIELIKEHTKDGISNLNEYFPISISEIKLEKDGKYTVINDSANIEKYYDKNVTTDKGITGNVVKYSNGKLKILFKDTDGKNSYVYAYPNEVTINDDSVNENHQEYIMDELYWKDVQNELDSWFKNNTQKLSYDTMIKTYGKMKSIIEEYNGKD